VARLLLWSRGSVEPVLRNRQNITAGGGATIRRFGASWMDHRVCCRRVPPSLRFGGWWMVVARREVMKDAERGIRGAEKQREPAVRREREKAEVVAVLMATEPLAKRRIEWRVGWAHAARDHARRFDDSCCTDVLPRCAEAADRGTPAHGSITPTSVNGAPPRSQSPHGGRATRRCNPNKPKRSIDVVAGTGTAIMNAPCPTNWPPSHLLYRPYIIVPSRVTATSL
jgi:hypothetical protein